MSWLIVILVAGAGIAYVLGPLMRPGTERPDPTTGLSTELAARKRAALLGIVDLDNERQLGKLNDDDYAALRSEYEAEAMVAIAELDQLEDSGDELEREIAELRTRLAEGDDL